MYLPFYWLNLAKLQLSITHCLLSMALSLLKTSEHMCLPMLRQTRDAQHNIMCYNCIMMSLSEDGQKIKSAPQSNHLDDECLFPSCATLFEILMNKALVDNQTTKIMNRTNLASLDIYSWVMNSNIEVFNQFVLDNHQALKNQGPDIDEDDMLEHLLDAYLLAQDNEFNAYIIQLKTSIDDGTLTQTAKQLM